MKRILASVGAVAVLVAALWLVCPRVSIRGQASATSAVDLVDPRTESSAQLLAHPARAAWQYFAFVNWPELAGHRGVPDPQRVIGDPGPTVWESYKNISEVFVKDGARPVPWEIDDEIPTVPLQAGRANVAQLAAPGSVDSPWIHYLAEQVMIDGQNICDSQSEIVEYDVRGDRPWFDYVANNPSGHPLYNMQGQQAALADPKFEFDFPRDAIEIKASWRIMEPGQDRSRYWTAIGVYQDNQGKLHQEVIGLTGLHIISKVFPKWFWMTFEQVDNAAATYKYFLQQKGAPVGANPNYNSSLDPVNQEWQNALSGTKWQYYALMGTQTAMTDAVNQPTLLGNTQMETYFQQNSSCMSCHLLTSIGPAKNPRLQVFGNNLNPYVGAIDFNTIANQQYPGQTFKEMDYTWSFRNAQYKPVLRPAATRKKTQQR